MLRISLALTRRGLLVSLSALHPFVIPPSTVVYIMTIGRPADVGNPLSVVERVQVICFTASHRVHEQTGFKMFLGVIVLQSAFIVRPFMRVEMRILFSLRMAFRDIKGEALAS